VCHGESGVALSCESTRVVVGLEASWRHARYGIAIASHIYILRETALESLAALLVTVICAIFHTDYGN